MTPQPDAQPQWFKDYLAEQQLNMRPDHTPCDFGDQPLGDSKLGGKINLADPPSAVRGADMLYEFICQLGTTVARSYRKLGATLLNTINAVIRGRSKEQVRRAETFWVVASVADVHPGWYGTNEFLVGQSVSRKFIPLNLQLSVPLWPFSAWPFKAGIIGIRDAANHLSQQFNTGNLVSHTGALHGFICWTATAFKRLAVSSIIGLTNGH